MITNEKRASYGLAAVREVASDTGTATQEPTRTAIIDVLAYVAHFCRRASLDPAEVFEAGLDSYAGDEEDGPLPEPHFKGEVVTLAEAISVHAAYERGAIASLFELHLDDRRRTVIAESEDHARSLHNESFPQDTITAVYELITPPYGR